MPLPPRQGLYDPDHEHDACGLGFVASLRREPSHAVVEQGIECRRPGVVRAAVDEAGRVAITGSAVVAFTASLDV